jgi:hypothetical protein
MKQEVRNFLRNLSNCWGIVQRCSFKLGNELVNIFRNASIGTTVVLIISLGIYSVFVFCAALVLRMFQDCIQYYVWFFDETLKTIYIYDWFFEITSFRPVWNILKESDGRNIDVFYHAHLGRHILHLLPQNHPERDMTRSRRRSQTWFLALPKSKQ